ncbi:MAG: hypothetical protein IPF60_09030 [Betaproteobacteria bacterium]|nr:hypothetical protein [Betaproteobacteria bacterium]
MMVSLWWSVGSTGDAEGRVGKSRERWRAAAPAARTREGSHPEGVGAKVRDTPDTIRCAPQGHARTLNAR